MSRKPFKSIQNTKLELTTLAEMIVYMYTGSEHIYSYTSSQALVPQDSSFGSQALPGSERAIEFSRSESNFGLVHGPKIIASLI